MSNENPASPPGESQGEAPQRAGERRQSILNEIREAESAHAKNEKSALDVAEHSRQQRDIAHAFYGIVSDPQVDDQFFANDASSGRLLASWRRSKEVAQGIQPGVAAAYQALIVSSQSTVVSTSTAVGSYIEADLSGWLSRAKAFGDLQVALSRTANVDALKAALVAFGLHEAVRDIRSPYDLVSESERALRVPSREEPSPTSVLIPMRGAIEGTLDRLLKRLPPPQQPCNSAAEKVELLGSRCAKDSYPLDYFRKLGADIADTLNNLSAQGKNRALTRQEVAVLLDTGINALCGLLFGLDMAKFRPAKP